MRYLRVLFVAILPLALAFEMEAQTLGNCSGYKIDGSSVVFNCEGGAKAKLLLCGDEVVKIWTDLEGTFEKSNQSFAVVSDRLDSTTQVALQETPQGYEIFTAKLIIRVAKQPFRISIFDKYQKLLMDDYQNLGFVKEQDQLISKKALRRGENIYGLGEKAGSLNRRGQTYKMWNSDKPCYGVNEDPLYKSIPFFMSSMGYGIFFDNTYKTEFDFGATSNSWYSFSSPGGEMIYYFIYGPDYKQMMQRYVHLTGNPIMPPQWALGFSQCRGMLTNEPLTREIAAGYREHKIPCDIIYQDIGWTEHLQDFEWRKGNYTNPKRMVNDLAQQGFKMIVSQDPVISQNNFKQWQEADSLGYFTIDTRTNKSYDMPWPWGGNCGVVDFTKPEVANWWGVYQQKVINDGVKGFWTDMGEPAWSNEESTDRLFMKHHLGMHSEIHNVYGLTWDKVVTEQFEKHNPNQRIFQMTRAAYAGLQRYTFGWSGDSGNGNNPTEGWEQLSNQIPVALSAGMGAIPFWSCDISGYCGDINDYAAMSELYVRWLQFGAFNTISRAHHEGNVAAEPWLFGNEATQICRAAIERKYQLFPYIYTYARSANVSGSPVLRAMVYEFPADPQTALIETQFMFGSELLVAPVMEQGATQKSVYLPQGEWVDFNDGITTYSGKKWIDYPVNLTVTPIFVKKGSIIPSMPVRQYIDEEANYPLMIEVFPSNKGLESKFELYEDDGTTNDYKKNVGGTRRFSCSTTDDGLVVKSSEESQNGFVLQKRALVYKLHTSVKPKSVSSANKKLKKRAIELPKDFSASQISELGWDYDQEHKICWITVPYGSISSEIIIK